MVQIREKDLGTRELVALTQTLLPIIRGYQGLTLINDRIDVVQALGAEGVHLRSDSLPVSLAREQLGNEKIIGQSTHSIDEVKRAEDEGANFVVLGPIFETASKKPYGPPLGLSVLEKACLRTHLPIFAIGGITPQRIPEILHAGGYGVAMISSIFQAPSIARITQEYLSLLS